jgi:hypothetical protein
VGEMAGEDNRVSTCPPKALLHMATVCAIHPHGTQNAASCCCHVSPAAATWPPHLDDVSKLPKQLPVEAPHRMQRRHQRLNVRRLKSGRSGLHCTGRAAQCGGWLDDTVRWGLQQMLSETSAAVHSAAGFLCASVATHQHDTAPAAMTLTTNKHDDDAAAACPPAACPVQASP